MKSIDIDARLSVTFDDMRLSRSERRTLKTDIATGVISSSDLAFWRHRAFELARGWAMATPEDPRHTALVLDWLEEICKALLPSATTERLAEAHFSPGEACRRRLAELIGDARHSVAVCVFTITDDVLCEAVLRAHARAVKIQIISDDRKAEDRGSDLARLAHAGIQTRCDTSRHHMHHKFMVVDNAIVATGSYNWTSSAALYNQENILVSDDPRLVRSYSRAFKTLWDRFE